MPSLEPIAQTWTSRTAQQWESIAGAAFYNVYRGQADDLAGLLTPSPESCLRLTTTATTTGNVLAENPPLGAAYWYLVRAANSAGEGPAGSATAGPRQQSSTGNCP